MQWTPILLGLIPSIAVGLLFWYVMRAVVRSDRNERAALAEIDRADAEARAQAQTADAPVTRSPQDPAAS